MKRHLPRSAVLLSALAIWVEAGRAECATAQAMDYVASREPVAAIGGRDEREAHRLHWAESALRLSDGRIVVGDVGSQELRFFDARGEHLRSVGGPGEGPGEFEGPWTMTRVRGDTVAVWTRAQRRLTLFPPEGEPSVVTISHLQALLTELDRDIEVGRFDPIKVTPASRDRVVIEAWQGNTRSYLIDGVTREVVGFALLGPAEEAWIKVGPFPWLERFAHGGLGGSLPFGRMFRAAVGDSVIFMERRRIDRSRSIIEDRRGHR